jgi:alkane 1-monooxygenase
MIRYGGPFLLLASIPAFYVLLGPWGPLLTIALLLAALIGAEFVSSRGPALRGASAPLHYRLLPYLYTPLQLGLIVWSMNAAVHGTPAGFVSLMVATGITTGVFGMLVAHEMAHSKVRGERRLATLMLSGMLYRHFRIAHVHVHHRWAATEHDSATARLGEGFYAFLARTVPGQFLEAWNFERKRCSGKSLTANRAIFDVGISLLTLAAIFALWSWRGVAFFVVQSALAITVLELFNYIAHYGLKRRMDFSYKPEPLSDSHSWNSSNVLVNLLIFNMGRHSYHHRKPAAPYESLEYISSAPELPAGYAGSILLALVPPLWRHVMDEKTLALRHPLDVRLAA